MGGGRCSSSNSSGSERRRAPCAESGILSPADPLLRLYLSHLREKGFSRKSQRNHMVQAGRFLAWLYEEGIDHPGAATANDLERFSLWLATGYAYRARRLGAGTRREYVGTVRSFYAFLLQSGHVLSDPARDLGFPKVPRRIPRDVMTVEEVWALLEQPDTESPSGLRDHIAMRLLAFTGLRVGALVRLNLREVDLEGRELMVRQGKGRKDRLVFFDGKTRSRLAEYLVCSRPALLNGRDLPALLVNDSGRRLSAESMRGILCRHARAAGIGKHLTPHSLRRTYCTLLIQAGCNLKVIADLAGHARLSTTARYTRILPQELAEAYRSSHPRSQA